MEVRRRARLARLSQRLLLAFGALLLVGFALTSYIQYFGVPGQDSVPGSLRRAQADLMRDLSVTADFRKALLEAWIGERRRDLVVFAEGHGLGARVERLSERLRDVPAERRPAAVTDDPDGRVLLDRIDAFARRHGEYAVLQIIDVATGAVLLAADRRQIGRSRASLPVVRNAQRSDREELIDWYRDISGESAHIVLARSIFASGDSGRRPLALALFEIPAEVALAPALRTGAYRLGETGEVILLDEDQRILLSLRHPLPDGSRATPLQYRYEGKAARLAAGGAEGSSIETDYRGREVVVAFRHLRIAPEFGWSLLVKLDKAEALAPLVAGMRFGLWLQLAGLVLVLAVTALLARRISRPVRALTRAAEAIAAGDLTARAVPAGGDEIGRLAEAFNRMADRLQQSQLHLEEEVAARTRQIEALRDGSLRLHGTLDPAQVRRTLVRVAVALVDAEAGAVGVVEDGEMVFDECFRGGEFVPIDYRFGPGEGVPGWVMQSRAPYRADDAERDPRIIAAIRRGLGLTRLVNLPVLSRNGAVIGCVELYDKRGARGFGDHDLELLTALAASAAVAFDNARLLAEAEARERQIGRLNRLYATLSETNEMIVRSRGEEELFRDACRIAIELGQMQVAVISRPDGHGGLATEVCRARRDHPDPDACRLCMLGRLGESDGSPLRCLSEGHAVVVNDVTEDLPDGPERNACLHCGVSSIASIPIRRREAVVAVFSMCASGAGFFDSRELALLEEIGRDLSFALENFERERRRVEAERQARQLAAGVVQSPVSIVITDTQGAIEYVNPKFEQVSGYTLDEVRGANPRLLKSGHTGADEYRALWQTISSGGVWQGEMRNRRKDGSLYWEQATISPIRDGEGRITHYIAVKEDITRHKEAQAAFQEQHHRIEAITTAANDAIISVDQQGRITFWNPAAERITGYAAAEVLGQPVHQVITPGEYQRAAGDGFEAFRKTGGGPVLGRTIEVEAVHKSGRRVPVELSISGFPSASGWQAVGLVRDISERKRAEQELQHHAFYDLLTGLPNRALFFNRLEHAIRRQEREAGQLFALLFLDLDRFKNVNDSLGHPVGDALLLEVGRRVADCMRTADTVARIGGDEFAVLLESIDGVAEAIRIADRIIEALADPVSVEGHEIYTSASIGIAVSAPHYTMPQELLRDADTAMYRAKASGRARYQLFDEEMHAHAVVLLRTETELRRAISRGEFSVYYQPIIALGSQRVAGFEALVRWRHPDRGLVLPGEFIPIAEETGLIIPIGNWVLREATRHACAWPRANGAAPWVAVNLSARQVLQPDLLRLVDDSLAESGLAAEALKLEVTESVLVENLDLAVDLLASIKARGVRLSLDDFGTGYSSLSYLQRFPFDTLKIDRSFINDPRALDGGIIRSIVTLAESLELEVVAEGVETPEQGLRLRELYPQMYGQGFHYSEAMPAERVARYLNPRPA